MLRQSVRGARLPLKTFNQSTQQAAWNGAWRRLFTSQSNGRVSSEIWRWKAAQPQGLLARLRPKAFRTPPGTIQGVLRRGFRSSAKRLSEKGSAVKEEGAKKGIKEQLKVLIKVYGWVTLGVYLGLSVLDFPFCFLFVRAVGTEAIGKVEHAITSTVKGMIPEPVKELWHKIWSSVKSAETKTIGEGEITGKVEMTTWGIEEAEQQNHNAASLATQLALAYAIHKSFIFFRVPLTAWVTPRVAKYLRARGWKFGSKTA